MSPTEDEGFYRLILDESSDPIFSFYPDGTYRFVNKAFAQGVGRPVEAIIGHRVWDLFPQEEADKRFAAVKQAFATGEDKVLEVKVLIGEKTTWYLTTVRPIRGEDGAVATVVCVSKNITDRRLAEDRLQHYATTDELTGVVNRRTGLAILQKLLDMARRSDTPFCLMYADVDGLKKVNDSLGHPAGDQLIIACCDAIRQAIRQADTLCRIGGDEFLVLLPDCDKFLARVIEQRIGERLLGFNESGDRPWKASLSIGLLDYRKDGPDSVESLVRSLDRLMYENKRSKARKPDLGV